MKEDQEEDEERHGNNNELTSLVLAVHGPQTWSTLLIIDTRPGWIEPSDKPGSCVSPGLPSFWQMWTFVELFRLRWVRNLLMVWECKGHSFVLVSKHFTFSIHFPGCFLLSIHFLFLCRPAFPAQRGLWNRKNHFMMSSLNKWRIICAMWLSLRLLVSTQGNDLANLVFLQFQN